MRPIPEDRLEEAQLWRSQLLDTVSLIDDEVMTSCIDTGTAPAEMIHRALRAATLVGDVQPTFCGSSLDYVGVQPLLDAVNRYLPSPLDRPPVAGINPTPRKNQPAEEQRRPSSDEPFAGLVFKIVADQHTELCFVRVYSGSLKSGSRMLNPKTGKKELISQLWHIHASQRQKLEDAGYETNLVSAGDIVGVIGPKDVVTGDTLCDPKHPILLESIAFPETVISMAIEPESSADRKKLEDALVWLSRQDPTIQSRVSEETGQTIISGMGELHLEICRERLVRDQNLKIRVHKPRVSYRETVKSMVEESGEFHRTVQGETRFAGVRVRLEPHNSEDAVTVISALKPGDIPAESAQTVREAVVESAQSGGSVGFPLDACAFHDRPC